VAVGKIQAYAVAIVGSGKVAEAVVVVHVTGALAAFVTVHVIVPAGFAPPVGPVTMAVKVVEPPKLGGLDAVMVTVGVI
jgi:hypothetical protein